MSISLTKKAAEHIEVALQERGKGVGIRLGITTTGCSGMGYKLEFIDEALQDDIKFESFGVTIYTDQKSLVYLDGIELDYAKEGLSEGFKFNNPNAKNSCGCGKSFHA